MVNGGQDRGEAAGAAEKNAQVPAPVPAADEQLAQAAGANRAGQISEIVEPNPPTVLKPPQTIVFDNYDGIPVPRTHIYDVE